MERYSKFTVRFSREDLQADWWIGGGVKERIIRAIEDDGITTFDIPSGHREEFAFVQGVLTRYNEKHDTHITMGEHIPD